jgi:hypothetical protein
MLVVDIFSGACTVGVLLESDHSHQAFFIGKELGLCWGIRHEKEASNAKEGGDDSLN